MEGEDESYDRVKNQQIVQHINKIFKKKKQRMCWRFRIATGMLVMMNLPGVLKWNLH